MRGAAENEPRVDFNERPFIAIWEATQACDLACVHCRASAQPLRSSFELSRAKAQRLIDQIAEVQVLVFVITGGDPLTKARVHRRGSLGAITNGHCSSGNSRALSI